MKNLLVLLFMATLFVGCTDKKQKEQAVEETAVEAVDSTVVVEETATVTETTEDSEVSEDTTQE